MLYPQSIDLEQKLGFDKIRSLIEESCISETGRTYVSKMKFQTDQALIERQLDQVNEFMSIIQLQENFPSLSYLDFGGFLSAINKEGSWIEEKEIAGIGRALQSFLEIKDFFSAKDEDYPQLSRFVQGLVFDHSLPREILDKFNEKDELSDNASPDLKRIRKDLNKVSHELRNSLTKIYKAAKDGGIVPENATPAVRDGRMVIPILAEHKKKFSGFIHDSSKTGHAVYIEPTEVLESNNRLKELEYEEKREIIRILQVLSTRIREDIDNVEKAFRLVGVLDFIRAKSKVSILLEAVRPVISDEIEFNAIKARHPVLYLNHKEAGENVVPLDIHFDQENRILLISGPNAGGKSVCLKTTGIIQYMVQCGILIPAHGDSRFGIFRDIMADIGDEQSIDNDLSTYSSHLKNMNEILLRSGKKSMILIDEFGTGTDPQYGGAIAEAILGKLVSKNVFGVITTHYNNLKRFAEGTNGIVNASMVYDVENLKPLFNLEIGKPGSSYAIEVASNIGLPEAILKSAELLVGENQIKTDNLLSELEKEKKRYEELLEQAKLDQKVSEESRKKYEGLLAELNENKDQILLKARSQAEEMLKSSNKEIEKTIRHIKENKAQKEETRKIRKSLNDFKKKVEEKVPAKPRKAAQTKTIEGPVTVGDSVMIVGNNVVGEVLSIKGKDAKVSIGGLQSIVKLSKLKKALISPDKELKKKRSSTFNYTDKKISFNESIDLRGKRAEEIIPILDKWLDDALVLGQHQLRILHGKGDGILRQIIRDYLRSVPEVISIKSEHADRGGDGITLIALK